MTATYNFILSTGVIEAQTSDLLAEVKQEWIGALGEGLDTDASTPQGTLIQNETLARTSVMKNNAEMGSLLNPNYSYGVYLDSIAAFLGIVRGKNTKTIAYQINLTGNVGVNVPAGSRIKTQDGDLFETQTAITLGATANLVSIASIEYGAIPVNADTVFTIAEGYGVIGWAGATVTTNSTFVPGTTALSDAALKAARNRQLYQQGVASLGAIYARAATVDGVTSVIAIENATGAAGTVNQITFSTPNGVWICVAGSPNKQQLVNALWLAKMGGQPYDFGASNQGNKVDSPNGTPVIDPSSGLQYFVKYTTPVIYDTYVYLTVSQGTSTVDRESIIDIVMQYAQGQLNGESGFVVGASISAFEVAGAVVAAFPGLYLKDAKIASVATGSAAPVYPGGYSTEWIANPWEQGVAQRPFVTVNFV